MVTRAAGAAPTPSVETKVSRRQQQLETPISESYNFSPSAGTACFVLFVHLLTAWACFPFLVKAWAPGPGLAIFLEVVGAVASAVAAGTARYCLPPASPYFA